MAGICNQLKTWTQGRRLHPDRRRVWRTRAHPDYLAVLGGDHGEYLDHRGNVQAGIDAGLIPMHATTASIDEWDEYEWKYCRGDRALRPRATRRSRRPGDARAYPQVARRVPALGPRHAGLRRVPLLSARCADRLMSAPAGYRLALGNGLKPGQRLLVMDPPRDFDSLLADARQGIVRTTRAAAFDAAVHSSPPRGARRKRSSRACCPSSRRAACCGWRGRRASGVAVRLSDETVRRIGMAAGLVDIKVCAVDARWSALKFVHRRGRTL